MRTNVEVIARVRAMQENDFLGFTTTDLLAQLPFAQAQEFLRPGAKESDWGSIPLVDDDKMRLQIVEYLPFAWDKANSCRGLSAGRSMAHFMAWLWLLKDDAWPEERIQKLDDYDFYGKPHLVVISEHFAVDWQALDNGKWQRNEGDPGITAEEALAITGRI